MSDENDETLLAPETLDYRSSKPINLHNDKDDDTVATSEMLECASTTPIGIICIISFHTLFVQIVISNTSNPSQRNSETVVRRSTGTCTEIIMCVMNLHAYR